MMVNPIRVTILLRFISNELAVGSAQNKAPLNANALKHKQSCTNLIEAIMRIFCAKKIWAKYTLNPSVSDNNIYTTVSPF